MSLGLDWGRPELIHLLWIVIFVIGWLTFFELRADKKLGAFLSNLMQRRLAAAPTPAQRGVRLGAIGLAMVFAVIALMQPQSRESKESIDGQKASGDIMVVLDVSKSMLAEDTAPNRLGRAKAEISAMVDKLRGHRVGLIAFAGKAAILSPLTPDYGFFRMMLRGASPTSVSRGGTAIGEALRLAIDAFDGETAASARLVLLITDGEDHDSYPREAADAAKDAKIRVVTVGLGSAEGAPILITDRRSKAKKTVVDKAGNPVISRVDLKLLEDIALKTNGAFVPAGTSALDLDSIVDEHIVPLMREAAPETSRVFARELYQWPVLLVFICLIISVVVVVPTRRREE